MSDWKGNGHTRRGQNIEEHRWVLFSGPVCPLLLSHGKRCGGHVRGRLHGIQVNIRKIAADQLVQHGLEMIIMIEVFYPSSAGSSHAAQTASPSVPWKALGWCDLETRVLLIIIMYQQQQQTPITHMYVSRGTENIQDNFNNPDFRALPLCWMEGASYLGS